MNKPEQWNAVVGYEGFYEVSDLGLVRSLDAFRRTRWGGLRLIPGRVLRPRLVKGYLHVILTSADGTRSGRYLHRLVLEAFVGPCPDGQECCHGPSGRLDNSLTNLKWGTKSENMADKARDGTDPIGERNPNAKLTEDDVAEIRRLYRGRGAGPSQQAIANQFGITQRMVSFIVRGQNWREADF